MIKVNVRELVEFAARKGDYFVEDIPGPDALEGIRGHRDLQQSRNPPWEAELTLRAEFCVNQQDVQLSGRADLCNQQYDPPILEEIKTCYGPGHLRPEQQRDLHVAQLKVYGALYSRQFGADKLELRLSYLDILSQQVFQEQYFVEANHCVAFCQDLLRIYVQWYSLYLQQKQSVIHRLKELKFPFEHYRKGQRETSVVVYRHILAKKNLLIDAPTGSGKTLSVLFPALKALGESKIKRLLYLTSKGSTQINALDALHQLGSDVIDCLVLQAKDKACPCLSHDQDSVCVNDEGVCTRTIGYYDRLPEARIACLQNKFLDTAELQAIANEYHLCPFALSLHMVPWISLVIADVNYYFDPLVQLAEYKQLRRSRILCLDEVHNLPQRARDMFSGELDSQLCESAYKELPNTAVAIKKSLQRMIRQLHALSFDDLANQQLPSSFQYTLHDLLAKIRESDISSAWTVRKGANSTYRRWLKQIYRFTAISQLQGDSHRFILQREGEVSTVKLRCLDAARFLSKQIDQSRAMIGFSATLRPYQYSIQQMGLADDTDLWQITSNFPPQNQLNVCVNYVDTQWQNRDSSLGQLVDLIFQVISSREGHYLVFFPSYQYLQKVHEAFELRYPNIPLLVQQQDDSDEARELFIRRFANPEGALLGFAIVGGVYSEGVDFPGDSLLGAVIIGTGMPQPDDVQRLMVDFYQHQGKNAYQFAYQFPGFIRLMQTAGRVIRSEKDRGVVIFVEPRLERLDYRNLMKNIPIKFCHNAEQLSHLIGGFWASPL